ncbi:hypothetical protein BJ166DRAFT_291300 [Pestalotiopsis sp. NC0098]|nr:hypothetical protein BJ166DRAFT_291300 [Pestalotiopsis sp. NC0098]
MPAVVVKGQGPQGCPSQPHHGPHRALTWLAGWRTASKGTTCRAVPRLSLVLALAELSGSQAQVLGWTQCCLEKALVEVKEEVYNSSLERPCQRQKNPPNWTGPRTRCRAGSVLGYAQAAPKRADAALRQCGAVHHHAMTLGHGAMALMACYGYSCLPARLNSAISPPKIQLLHCQPRPSSA